MLSTELTKDTLLSVGEHVVELQPWGRDSSSHAFFGISRRAHRHRQVSASEAPGVMPADTLGVENGRNNILP